MHFINVVQGCNGEQFEGKLFVWIKLLLPGTDKRVFNLQSRQLIKLFAKMFRVDQSDMLTHLEQGKVFFYIYTYHIHVLSFFPLFAKYWFTKVSYTSEYVYGVLCIILSFCYTFISCFHIFWLYSVGTTCNVIAKGLQIFKCFLRFVYLYILNVK